MGRLSQSKFTLEDTCERQDETSGGSDEEDGRDVKREGDRGVGEHDEGPNPHERVERLEALSEDEDDCVKDGTNGSVLRAGEE